MILIIVVTVSVVLGVVGAVAYHYYSQQKWAEFEEFLTLQADQIAIGLAPAAWNLEYSQIGKLMESQMRDRRYVGIAVELDTKRLALVRDEQGAVQSLEEEIAGDGLRLGERQITFSDQAVGKVKLYATSRYLEAELSQAFAFLAVSVVLLDLVLTLGLYLSLQRLVLHPLRRVERYAEEVARGGTARTALGNVGFLGELERLTCSIDAMVRQLAMRHGELLRSTERFQTVIRLLPIPLALYDQEGRNLFLNDRFTTTFGYSIDDVPTMDDWLRRAYPDVDYRREVMATWEREVAKARHDGVPIRALAYRVKCGDGQERIVEIGGILSENIDIAILDDVTDRTLTEQELARHREHLEELVSMRTAELANTYQRLEETQFAMDHAGIGIVWVDATSGHVRYVNDQACDMVGYSADALQAMDVVDVATELTHERLRQLGTALLEKGFVRLETILLCADGGLLPVEASLYFKAPGGERPGHYIAFLTDITQRKAAEKALIEAKLAAETAAQSRSEFLANMSHEIRTPMNAIIGMSQLVLQTDLDKKQRNFIEKAHLSAVSLLGILNDILDFSKVEAGRLDIDHINFSIDSVFENLANLVALKAEEKGLELLFDIAPEVPRRLAGDPLRLGQILTNLAGNAVKFTEAGTVLVSCRVAERTGDQARLEFIVRDSGIGMSEEQAAALFIPFHQGDSSISRRYGGTGLGLVICRRLASLMGGTISVASQVGRGSTFSFAAPFEVPVVGDEAGRILPDALHGQRVLVVDDNQEARDILGNLLGRLGMVVDRAASAREALALMQPPGGYRLLLCDWKMPAMDGVELVRALATVPGARAQPIVMLANAYRSDELRRAAAGLPLAGILAKPVLPSSLLDLVLAVTGNAPLAADGQTAANPLGDRIPTLAGASVLLVEDNSINQELAQELLQSAGAVVTVADNGRQALDRLAAGAFDCVLMDVQMPVMDGLEATRAIRAQERFRDLPIIAMTAGALPRERELTSQAGMNDHVTKPIDVEQLFSVMRRCMNRPPLPVPWRATAPPPAAQPGEPPHLDVARALALLGGNRQAYQRVLKVFLATSDDAVGNLREAADNGDAAKVAALAHGLKGGAGSVGALPMQELARRLEEAARHGASAATLMPLARELAQVWQATRAAGTRHVGPPAEDPWAGGATGPAQQALATALERLRNQLQADDTDALESLDVILEGPLPEPLRAELTELARYVTKYQFAGALRALERVLVSRRRESPESMQRETSHDDSVA